MEQSILSPLAFLRRCVGDVAQSAYLEEYQEWWDREGKSISAAVDRAGIPWLRMFDSSGRRVDEILYPPDYWQMLRRGYQAGVVWRVFAEHSLIPHYLLGYLTSFYDAGLYCPYTVSLSTAVPLAKYGTEAVKARFLPAMLRRDETVWQGATWMTEVGGGSDLGASVQTIAVQAEDCWYVSGDKYFASNVGAELAVVAARLASGLADIRGLGLFLVPRYRSDGSLNYTVRRLKDKIGTRSVPTGEVELRHSESYLLGQAEWGIYLILETLNLSRVANSVGSVALAQRALADAVAYAHRRQAFGKPIAEHPLLRHQIEKRIVELEAALALAWEAVRLLDQLWQATPRYPEQYHLFRLLAHLAKYWTAEYAVQTAKWAMEVYGGIGTLAEFGVERWLRDAMILPIWEGTPHRQILDGLEVMERKGAHRMLFQYLAPYAQPQAWAAMQSRVEEHLALPQDEKEAGAEDLFRELASFTAHTLRARRL
ncbi:MAG: acyl-CoA dehydrogenase family protein [Chloroflexus sp.]|nr:acyl-CoA dehydrogenase family protein [Chloroflexus sp.]